jgi:DNA polymerase III subunit alpha
MVARDLGGELGEAGGVRPFVNLRVHSAFSLLEGALSIAKIADFAVADGAPAIGIADTDNLFGALDFAQKLTKAGVQPIIGCQLPVVFTGAVGDCGQPVVLIAASEEGYSNLMRLVSRAYMESVDGKTVGVPESWLSTACAGLICLTGGARGPVGSVLLDDPGEGRLRLERLKALFGGRLYVELSRQSGYDADVEAETVALAYALELPLVATNEAFFASADDYEAHDALLAIADGALLSQDNRRRLNPDYCLKTGFAGGN